MKVLPTNGYVLCKNADDGKQSGASTFIYGIEDKKMPVYEVVDFSPNVKNADFAVGDKVIASSIPTMVALSDAEQYYLVKLEHIAGKIS